MKQFKGSIPLLVAVVMAGGTILASYLTASGTVNTRVAVVEERENNHYKEIQKQVAVLTEAINKLDIKVDAIGVAVKVPTIIKIANTTPGK